jgi:hypothetical protein
MEWVNCYDERRYVLSKSLDHPPRSAINPCMRPGHKAPRTHSMPTSVNGFSFIVMPRPETGKFATSTFYAICFLLGSYLHCTSSEGRAIQHQIRVSAHYFLSLTFVPKFQPYRRHKKDEVLAIRTLTEQRLRARILFGCSTPSDALNRLWELIRRSAPCDFTFPPPLVT